MQCPFCKSESSKVLESRSADDSHSIRRRRECLDCSQRFTTYERIEFSPMLVIKKNGSREVFSREKLIRSIVSSCSKAQISALTVDKIVDKVESCMYKQFTREIEASLLGEMVMEELKFIDPMAYLRYASIFKKINSVREFIDEMKKLENDVIAEDLQAIALLS